MSLITRCPACETMFKVVPDQLRVSDGWVRCGQCGEIFDAPQHLIPDPNESAEPAGRAAGASARGSALAEPPPPVSAAVEVASSVPAELEILAAVAPTEQLSAESPAAPSVQLSRLVHLVEAPAERDQVLAADNGASESPWVATVVPEQEVAIEEAPPTARHPTSSQAAETPAVEPPPQVTAAPALSFMQSEEVPRIWQRPAVRIMLVLLVVVLLAVLAAQVLVHERDRVGAAEPSTRPLLLALCTVAQCSLSPVRQIESIAIESSSFTMVRPDNYKLAFALKNNAALDLAVPAIELSLTDAQDQPLIRRVILASEFAAAPKAIVAGSDWSSSLPLAVRSNVGAERVVGYRLLAFYP